MSANLDRVLAALEAVGIDPTARETVEALWLAARIAERAGGHAHEPVQPPAPADEERATAQSTAPEPTPAPPPPAPRPPRPADTTTPATLHAPAPIRTADETSPRAVAVRVPDAPALSGELQLLRALRPLKRRVPSRHRVQLDETATAERSAEERLFLPATRPEPDRWLSLALVMEASPTMTVWRSLVGELMALLQRSAAFRDIRLWHLHAGPDGTRVGLHPQMVPTGALHSPREILDPTGRQVIWCISDCVSALWHDGRADRLLELWGRAGPLAIVQPLPQRLWRRSGLRPERVLLRTDTPGAPNSLLRVTSPDSSVLLRGPARGVPVPVLELEPSWLTPWTRLVTATAPDGVPAVVTTTRVASESSPDAGETSDSGITPPTGRPDEPLELVRAFRANSSPQAYRLAGCLAAAPLTLPVMRLVQRVMLPASRPAHLAEVLLSGLLQRTGPDPADLEYDFLDGVRDVLLSTLRRSESRRVHDQVSAYLEAHAGDARDTPALAVPSSGRGTIRLPATSRPFAEIRLRGDRRPADADPGRQPQHATPDASWPDNDRPAALTWDEQLSDFLASAQPGVDPDQGSLFTGRQAALAAVSRWLDEGISTPDQNADLWRRGLAVVTASPGSGKSALLARLAVLASPTRRTETLELPPEMSPSPGVLDVVMSARNSTDQDVLDRIAAVAVARDATVDAIVAALAARSDQGQRPFTVVIDAVDEAVNPGRLCAEVLFPLLRRSEGRIRLLLAVRRHLLPVIREEPAATGRDALVIDLDGLPYADFEALKSYAARNLESPHDSPYRSSVRQREEVAHTIADAAGHSFLTARILASALAFGTHIFDRAPLSSSAADAMDMELLARLGDQTQRAFDLLTPLAFAQGQGLPWQDVWAPLASAMSGRAYTDEDVLWLQTAAESYIHRTNESGTFVFRTCHSVIDESLRERRPGPGVHEAFFDTLTASLPHRADGTRDWSSAHPYALAHLAYHAYEAGRLGLLLEDAEYLVHAAPHRLSSYLEQSRSRQAAVVAAVLQGTVDVPGADRRGSLALTAARVGATDLLRQLVDGAAPQQWMPLWATGSDGDPEWRAVGPGDRGLAAAVACTVVQGRPVAVTGHRDGRVVLLDLAEKRTLGVPLTGHTGSVVAVACTDVDGQSLAVTGGNDGTVRLWDLAAGCQVGAPLTGHVRPVTAVDCALIDGRPVAVTGGYDGTIRLWDLTTGGQLRAPLHTQSWPVTTVACTVVDGRPVAVTGGYDGTLTLWDLASGRKFAGELIGHDGPVIEVACTVVDGHPVAVTGGYDGTVRLWDLAVGRQLRAPLPTGSWPVTAVASTVVDGHPVALTGDNDGTVRLWDLRDGSQLARPTRQYAGPVTAVACTIVDERAVAVIGGRADEYVLIRDLDSLFDGPRVRARPQVEMLACTPTASRSLAVTGNSDQTLSVWDISTGRQLFRLTHPDRALASVACTLLHGSPVAVTGGLDGTVRLWDLAAGSQLSDSLTADDGPVTAIACTTIHDQPVIVTGGDGMLAIWSLGDLGLILQQQGVGRVTAVACPTVGTPPVAVTGDYDGLVRMWALESASQLGSPLAAHTGPVTAVACTVVNGRPVAVTGGHDGVVRLLDVLTGQAVGAPLVTHGAPVTAVACTVVDGRSVAVTGGQDGTVRLWDVQARRQLQFFATAGPATAAFTLDGRLALGLGSDLAVLHHPPAGREPHHTSRPSDLYT
ncbi:WD40 repeat domain-containing protein [Streptomyces avermitilis]|uniref:WD40 repeat domain-containing protein n=1 Tax=Streptomyces avermitilis TaxID=33903 RepID=UPI0033E74C61